MTDSLIEIIGSRICPDIPKEAPWYRLKNGYTNRNERVSFSIDIYKCDGNKFCKSDGQIEQALKNMYLTFFHSETQLNFEHFDENPMLVQDGYHSQV